MKSVLVIGSGGREQAIANALSRSPQVSTVFVKDGSVDELLIFARTMRVDLTVVGPEAALAKGVVDAFRAAGLPIFGHTKAATQIESSKEFAKQIMARAGVPTAHYEAFSDFDAAWAYTQSHGAPIVLKYDGLAAGKGVVVAMTLDEAEAALRDMLVGEAFGQGRVVIEDYLTGPEFSFMCFVNGHDIYPMPIAQDHKRAFDGDRGPNTGGMGAYTPVPFISAEDIAFAEREVLQRTADAMVENGTPLTGVLYGGLMRTPDGVKVIEFNARFGDPETEVILPLLQSDAYDIFYALATGQKPAEIRWSNDTIVGVVLASKGYPGSYEKGFPIEIPEAIADSVVSMGVKVDGDRLLTAGGRVLMVLGTGATIREARDNAYAHVEQIHCDNLFYRTDIAHQAL